ncbi:M13 family metallopeptidase [Luteibacter yeojuensis]
MGKGMLRYLSMVACTMSLTWGAVASDITHGTGRDTSVAPGDDFYAYANGRWLRSTTIPADHAETGSLQAAVDGMDEKLRILLDTTASAPVGTHAAMLQAYFRSFSDMPSRDEQGMQPVKGLLDEIAAVPDRHAISSIMGREQVDFTGSLLDVSIDVDHTDGHRYAAFLSQSGLLLPDRSYYLDPSFSSRREALRNYLIAIFVSTGTKDARHAADDVITFETAVAKASWADDRQVPANERHLLAKQLTRVAPGINWPAFFKAAGIGANAAIVLSEPGAARKLSTLFAKTPLPVLQEWLVAHAVDRAAPFLDSRRVSDYQRFHGAALSGRSTPLPAWQLAVRGVTGSQCVGAGGPSADCFGTLRWAAGDLYLATNFPDTTRRQARIMIDELRAAFRKRLEAASWMAHATRVQAVRKLDAYTVKLGGPERATDLHAVVIEAHDLPRSARSIASSDWGHMLARLGERVDPTLWVEALQSVDANNGSALDVEFPAGLLQAPVFDPARDAAYNFGAIGAFIGHEWTHGFDDDGRHIDADNRQRDWWTARDEAQFRKRATRLARQYDGFEPLPGQHVRGAQTLSENIADVGGVSVALDAYHASLHGQPASIVDGLTGDQRVLLGWAWLWRGKKTREALQSQLVNDVHAPFEARVNGVVRNLDAWYDAFGVHAGQRLFLAPGQRVRIW